MKKLFWIYGLLFFFSCEQRIIEVPEFEVIESDRVVLLEEMTGVSCPNCPKGAAEIEAIKSLYGDQVIPVGIHGLFLSWPTPESKYDFRNSFAEQLELNLAPGTSKPAALINRAYPEGSDDKVIISPDLWSGVIEEQLNIPPRVSIELEVSYNPENFILSINAGVIALETIDENLMISVMILENHIEDAQEDLQEIIEDFEHNHVLRYMLTEFDGDPFANGMSAMAIKNESYNFLVPQDEDLWVVENLEVVVFIHQEFGAQEVLQAAVKKLNP